MSNIREWREAINRAHRRMREAEEEAQRLREERDKWKERAVEVGRRAFDAESLLAQQKATLERDDLTPAAIVTLLRGLLLEPQAKEELPTVDDVQGIMKGRTDA